MVYLPLIVLDAPGNIALHHSSVIGLAGYALDSPSEGSEGAFKVLEIVRNARCSTIIDSNRY